MKINPELNQLSDKHRKILRWPNVQHTDGQMYNVQLANITTYRWPNVQCKDGQTYNVQFVKCNIDYCIDYSRDYSKEYSIEGKAKKETPYKPYAKNTGLEGEWARGKGYQRESRAKDRMSAYKLTLDKKGKVCYNIYSQ